MQGLISYSSRFIQHTLLVITCFFITSCMVGPNFKSPDAPTVTSYNESKLPSKSVVIKHAGKAGPAQIYVYNRDIPAEWWHLFKSPEIDELVKTGMMNSPNLASAQAALKQAQEALYAQIGNSMFPALNAGLSGERQRFSGASIGSKLSGVFNLFNASVNVSYTLDIFGGARREIESLQAQVDYQQFQLIAAYLTLTSNIVTTSITVAELEEQIDATKKLIAAEEGQLEIIRKQYHLGGVADTNVLQQQTLVEQARATLPPLEQSLSQSKHALSVLVGNFPNQPLPTIHLSKLTLPTQLPVSLPSKLVRQRPDVRASEALLHSASAQIGVATANLFPQFNITGNYGFTSTIPSSLFSGSSKVWSIANQITQPIFHGGALFAARRQAIDAYDQAAAQYRQTLLQAFQNVADSLRAIDTGSRTFKEQKSAEIAARDALTIITKQYHDGGIAYLNLLNAQQQYQQTRIASVQSQAARYTNTAALFQALGGGWWNREIATCSDPINPNRVSMICPS